MIRSRCLSHQHRRPQIFRSWRQTRAYNSYWPNKLTNQNCSELSDLVTIQPWTFRTGFRNRQLINVSNASTNTLNRDISIGDSNATVIVDTVNDLVTRPQSQFSLSNGDSTEVQGISDGDDLTSLATELGEGSYSIRMELSFSNRDGPPLEERTTETVEYTEEVIAIDENVDGDDNEVNPNSLFNILATNGLYFAIVRNNEEEEIGRLQRQNLGGGDDGL